MTQEEQLLAAAMKDCHIDSSVVRFRIVGSRMELWDFYGNPHVWTIPIGMLPHAPEATGGGNAEPVKVRAGIKPAPTTPRKGRLRKSKGNQ
jgi:hypothetical protein